MALPVLASDVLLVQKDVAAVGEGHTAPSVCSGDVGADADEKEPPAGLRDTKVGGVDLMLVPSPPSPADQRPGCRPSWACGGHDASPTTHGKPSKGNHAVRRKPSRTTPPADATGAT